MERVAGRIRHRRMHGREESEEGLDIVEDDEDDEDMADMKNGILVRGIKAVWRRVLKYYCCGRSLKAVLEKFHLAFDCDSRLCNVV